MRTVRRKEPLNEMDGCVEDGRSDPVHIIRLIDFQEVDEALALRILRPAPRREVRTTLRSGLLGAFPRISSSFPPRGPWLIPTEIRMLGPVH